MGTPDDLEEFRACQTGYAGADDLWHDLSRGAVHWIDGSDENALAIGLKPILSGDRSEDEGLFVRQHEYWAQALIDALCQSEVRETGESRAYSFSSKPGAEQASFLIRNVPGGLMSSWLTGQARGGDRMRFVGPNGSFFLRDVTRPLVMLAGGTGLAPLLSMLEVLADQGTEQPIRLIYGVTHDGDLAEIERIEALASRLPTLTWAACVADEASAHPLKGYVTHHLTDADMNEGDCDVYLCGPPPNAACRATRAATARRKTDGCARWWSKLRNRAS